MLLNVILMGIQLDKWSKKWLLNFNPQKSKAVCFSTKKSSERPSLKFQSFQIEFVSYHKHLGIIFSENLDWSTYIGNIISTAFKKLNLMKKFKFKLNRKAISLMYKSFIRPHLEYASDVWGGCSPTRLSLQRNYFLKMYHNISRSSCNGQ